jgi:hypothetical protein
LRLKVRDGNDTVTVRTGDRAAQRCTRDLHRGCTARWQANERSPCTAQKRPGDEVNWFQQQPVKRKRYLEAAQIRDIISGQL